jgi:hypothetical protein
MKVNNTEEDDKTNGKIKILLVIEKGKAIQSGLGHYKEGLSPERRSYSGFQNQKLKMMKMRSHFFV